MKVGYALCGSFCTIGKSLEALMHLKEKNPEWEVVPVISEHVATIDTRFGNAEDTVSRAEKICGRGAVKSIVDAEPLGPSEPLDLMIICPCTGNTLAKLALGITDTSVTMAAKAHLRCDRPLVIALATNDAMSANFRNIAALISKKCVYFVPMRQDDPVRKPHSLVADFSLLERTVNDALNGKQTRQVFI
ncbi:MAG: dipicolinate synthase subunit B [Eubacteriales bacterium]